MCDGHSLRFCQFIMIGKTVSGHNCVCCPFAVVVWRGVVGADDARNWSISWRRQLGRNQLSWIWTPTVAAAILSRCAVSSTFNRCTACCSFSEEFKIYFIWWFVIVAYFFGLPCIWNFIYTVMQQTNRNMIKHQKCKQKVMMITVIVMTMMLIKRKKEKKLILKQNR